MRRALSLLAACAGLGATSAPALAQDGGAGDEKSNAICSFHGDGCSAPPVEWSWQRLEPRIGAFSIEIPCDKEQADAFGQLLAMSRAPFEASNTRACMKATSGFTATLIGLTAVPDGAVPPESEKLLQGAPDVFTAFVNQGVGKGVPETKFQGRRAIVNTIEKDDRRSKVAIIEVGQFGIVLLSADIRSEFPGTREESDALVERFFNSLEIVE